MALGITTYVDPGVYVQEKIQPGSITVSSDRVLCIVGIAPRTRQVTDEAVVRGTVSGETLSVATSTPYIATLSSVCNKDRNNAILYKNAQAVALGNWSFNSAILTGTELAGANVDVSTATGRPNFTFSVDGKDVVTVNFQDGQTAGIITAANAATIVEIAAWINYELSNALGTHFATYGSAYSAFASKVDGVTQDLLLLTSPLTTSASDIRVYESSLTDAASTISNAAWAPSSTAGVQAASVLTIADSIYSATAEFTIDYVATDTWTDPLASADADTPLSSFVSVGSFPGGFTYTEDTDYEDTGNTIDWQLTGTAEATVTGTVATPFALVLNTNDEVKMSINGGATITITLTAGGAVAASAIVAEINAALVASSDYGPMFGHVASVSTSYVKLTAPSPFLDEPSTQGSNSSIVLFTSTNTAITTIFGLTFSTSVTSFSYVGVSKRPSVGSVYYASYNITRDSDDYTLPQRVYNVDQLYDYTSPLTDTNYTVNKLGIAGEIAFENGVSSLILVQVDDTSAAGSPTQNEINAAIDVCEESSSITDIVVLDTAQATAVSLMDHVSNMSSLFEKKYRRGWYGMARSTAVGDPDTPDTYVYWSTSVLQPGNTSAGRGRQILCAPADVSRTLTLSDATEVTVELDGSYVAVADASVYVSLPSPADALLGKTITGFLTDTTFETYLQGQRYTLAGNGVNVNTLEGGRIIMKDPLTTEDGYGKVIQFAEPSSSAQKDTVVRAIEAALDANVKGLVPDNLSNFLVQIKIWVALAIKAQINAGAIAPYRNSDGTTRDIDLLTDIQVEQDTTDPRSFSFKFWFNLKYVAKRFFGEYSVDNPFFAG